MKYLRVTWDHGHVDEPIVMFSEIDGHRFETRKVEVFRGGRYGHASAGGATGETALGIVPVPELIDIAEDAQFEAVEITAAEFEEVWELVARSTD